MSVVNSNSFLSPNWTMREFLAEENQSRLSNEDHPSKRDILTKIYQYMENITTLIESGREISTGFYAHAGQRNFFITTNHTITKQAKIVISDRDQGLLIGKCETHDMCMLNVFSQTDSLIPIRLLPIAPIKKKLYIGQTVYFLGFPLAQKKHVLHKGQISCIEGDKFLIDGTVVPCHSGSPVAILSKDKKDLYIVGMILSEAIHSFEAISEIVEHKNSEIRKVAEVYQSNVSTGMGWAVDLRTCKTLMEKEENTEQPVTEEYDEYLISKENRMLEVTGSRVPYPIKPKNFQVNIDNVLSEFTLKGLEKQGGNREVTLSISSKKIQTRAGKFTPVKDFQRIELQYAFYKIDDDLINFNNFAQYHGNEAQFYEDVAEGFMNSITNQSFSKKDYNGKESNFLETLRETQINIYDAPMLLKEVSSDIAQKEENQFSIKLQESYKEKMIEILEQLREVEGLVNADFNPDEDENIIYISLATEDSKMELPEMSLEEQIFRDKMSSFEFKFKGQKYLARLKQPESPS